MPHAKVNGVELAYDVVGPEDGEPMLLIHGALIADATRPLLGQPALERFEVIRYDRRGHGGSTRPAGPVPTSVEEQSDDAIGLLDHLGVDAAHVVGHSGGALVALELASSHPERVATLSLLEPPFPTTESAEAFIAGATACIEQHMAGDPEGAVTTFLRMVAGGTDRLDEIERVLPGAIAQAVKDAATFFEAEMARLGEWSFGPEDAAGITCPVLSVLGTATAPLFVEGRKVLHELFSQCHDADIEGATHMLQMEEPTAVAEAIAGFIAAVETSRLRR